MLKKIIIFLCFFSLSVFKTGAFLDSDQGLDLYKQIDQGISKLKTTQLDYELKGGDEGGNVSENLNKQLESDGLKKCLKGGLSTEKIQNILDKKDVNALYNTLSPECTENGLTNLNINNYMLAINKYKREAENRADNKSKKIFQVAQIGLYTDGNIENSPFDLIVDLQEIDKIIFGEEEEYEGEEINGDFLDEFENNPFIDGKIEDKEDQEEETDEKIDKDDNNENNNNDNENDNNPEDDPENTIINNPGNNDITQIPDGNNYVCPDNNDASGLSPEELNILKNSIKGDNGDINFTFRTTASGYIKLPETNQINVNGTIGDSTGTGWNLGSYTGSFLDGDYTEVDDNEQWKCTPDSFFCITIEFITSNHKGLGYGKSKSIEEIIKISNKHLKKGTNTSLLQSKMSTNNFENILRDLDFPNMLHMGIIISKKAPPFLKLNRNFPKKGGEEGKEEEKTKDPLFKKFLTNIYKSQGLDYERKNDLSILTKKEKKLRDTIDIAELNPSSLAKKEKQREYILKHLNVENEVEESAKDQLISQGQLKEFSDEFAEYVNFIGALQSYSERIMGYAKKLHDKPRGD